MERSAETTRDDPDGEYLKRNRWFESPSLRQRVHCEPDFPEKDPDRSRPGRAHDAYFSVREVSLDLLQHL